MPIVLGPLHGKKWVVGAHNHGCWLGTYEPEMQQLMAREIAPGSVFYDVGANAGFYSLLASMRVKTGTVFSFEPLPENVAYLKQHLKLNDISNVRVLELAIGNESGVAHFSTESTRAMGKLEPAGDLIVQVSSLDLLLDQGDTLPPHAVKMDIEGAEYLALQGASRCFARYRPKLFLATHGEQLHELCCELLRRWGYELRSIRPRVERGHAEIFAVPRELC